MMKKFSFYLVLSMLCLSFTVLGQEVEISIDHPDQVNAGSEFTVTVTINKGSLTDYSRFSQDLPLGLTATNVSSPNADFSFDNQRIRIIWLKLPEEKEVTVSYNILVNERLKGSFILGGVFAFVVEEERKFLNFEKSTEINIIPSSTLDPALIVDIKDFKEASLAGPALVKKEAYAMAIRQKPILLSSGGYLIKLLINNPSGSKYAKIEETIPSGYMFEEVDSYDGIVSFAASTVKFIWMKLPEESEYEVIYRLLPKSGESQGPMVIEGLLTYNAGNENKLVEVKEVDVALEDLSLAQKKNLLATGEVPSGARKSGQTVQEDPPVTPETKAEPVVRTEAARQTPARQTPVTATQTGSGTSGGTIKNTKVLSAGTGVYFRVQLTANRVAFDGRSHFRRAGVDREVFVEEHNGLYKYTAGSFQTYSQAASYRKQLVNLPDVRGAFVVAYRDGKRIPVASTR